MQFHMRVHQLQRIALPARFSRQHSLSFIAGRHEFPPANKRQRPARHDLHLFVKCATRERVIRCKISLSSQISDFFSLSALLFFHLAAGRTFICPARSGLCPVKKKKKKLRAPAILRDWWSNGLVLYCDIPLNCGTRVRLVLALLYSSHFCDIEFGVYAYYG
ncbi:hypothetical protein TSAR_001956 [Trichomalopsis sarcophagae]|uniref:Uncharacterized protein n=1 Tax=Trichomalopsis sarcophagae TaxID=543379 RepID=A0A232EFL8_9HYME|nr:hypothetical protein TSAR_001956 [Trichomalopsis sarcophagae]